MAHINKDVCFVHLTTLIAVSVARRRPTAPNTDWQLFTLIIRAHYRVGDHLCGCILLLFSRLFQNFSHLQISQHTCRLSCVAL